MAERTVCHCHGCRFEKPELERRLSLAHRLATQAFELAIAAFGELHAEQRRSRHRPQLHLPDGIPSGWHVTTDPDGTTTLRRSTHA